MSGTSLVFLEMGRPDQGAEETCSRCYSEVETKLRSALVSCDQVWSLPSGVCIIWWGWFSNREGSWVVYVFCHLTDFRGNEERCWRTRAGDRRPRNQGLCTRWFQCGKHQREAPGAADSIDEVQVAAALMQRACTHQGWPIAGTDNTRCSEAKLKLTASHLGPELPVGLISASWGCSGSQFPSIFDLFPLQHAACKVSIQGG